MRILNGEAVTAQPIKASEINSQGFKLDFQSWLPFAAKELNISPRMEDYALLAAPLHYSDLPNRNGIAMPLDELLRWDTESGCQAYRTWVGKPMFLEHKSDIVRDAYGIIVDVALRPITGFGNNKIWKMMALIALDRTKNPELVGRVERKELNTFSMGAMIEGWTCSVCGAAPGKCHHIDPAKPVVLYELNGELVFKNVHTIRGYEYSIVEDPACVASISDIQIKLKP